ncbi:MAG TPA: M23 family metallopeptidase [Bacteroidia bacterium]|nr:M23 family metallopeptidase [Bacteroidia bacterium]
MKIQGKKFYWGIGIGLTVLVTGILLYRHRKKIKSRIEDTVNKAENWLKPVAAKITSKFGHRIDPKTGKPNEFHNGIDLAVPSGTPIKSPMNGVVDAINSGGPGGNELIVKHSNGFKTGYAHLTKTMVKKGDKIQQGQVIALSGNTGKSTGPHLHFTVTDPSGAKVDPQKLIFG